MSPKNGHCFGIADVTPTQAHLHAYIYQEETGNKGGNSVASLVMRHLVDEGVIIPGRLGGKLTLIFDNCPGQNKNNHVLRLANYLVELGYFKEVYNIFYVRGHTKNACDRLFNLLKIRYHKRNVYTFTQLLKTCNEMIDCTVHEVHEDDFDDYFSMENLYYKKIVDGEILKNHIFFASRNAPHILNIKQCADSAATIQQDLRKLRFTKGMTDKEKE